MAQRGRGTQNRAIDTGYLSCYAITVLPARSLPPRLMSGLYHPHVATVRALSGINKAHGGGGGTAPFTNTHSVELNGATQYLIRSTSNVLMYDQPGSLTAWIKTSTSDPYPSIVATIGAGKGMQWHLHNGQPSLYIPAGAWLTATSSDLRDGEWHFIAATWNGDTEASGVDFYVDGQKYGHTGSSSITGDISHDVIAIGRYGEDANYFYGGLLDEVAFFQSKLSDAQVLAMWNGGTPASLTSLNPYFWLRFTESDDLEGGSGGVVDWGGGAPFTAHNTDSNNLVGDVP